MQLAAKRQVTREEDIAYCLLGIFDVSISTAYGEGAGRAFFRLVEEIFRSKKNVSDIFNWAGDRKRFSWQPTTSLLPSHPSHYNHCVPNQQWRPWRPIEPFTLTHLGLRTPILLMPAVSINGPLIFWVPHPIGSYHAAVSIPATVQQVHINGSNNLHYQLLDKQVFVREQFLLQAITFGTLNVEEGGTSIHIPKTCLAVLLRVIQKSPVQHVSSGIASQPTPSYQREYTTVPIIFNLKKTGNNPDEKHYYELERSELAKHGMELTTLYL